MSRFWRNWLTVWCWGLFLFGVVIAGGGFEATSGPIRLLLQILGGRDDFDLNPLVRFSLGVLGPVSMGWSITLMAAIKAAHQLDRQAARPIWILVTFSAACWFALDSTISIHTGFWRNAIPNVGLMAGYLLPVIRSGVLKR